MSSLLFIWIILNPLAPKSDLHVTSLNKMHTMYSVHPANRSSNLFSRSYYLDLIPSPSN